MSSTMYFTVIDGIVTVYKLEHYEFG